MQVLKTESILLDEGQRVDCLELQESLDAQSSLGTSTTSPAQHFNGIFLGEIVTAVTSAFASIASGGAPGGELAAVALKSLLGSPALCSIDGWHTVIYGKLRRLSKEQCPRHTFADDLFTNAVYG